MGRGQHPGRSQAQDAQRGPAEAWRRGLMRDSLKHAGDRAQLHKLLGNFPAVLGNGVLPPPQPVLGVSSGNKQNPCGPDAWGLSRCAQGVPVCRGHHGKICPSQTVGATLASTPPKTRRTVSSLMTMIPWGIVLVPVPALANGHRAAQNNTNFLSHSSGGWKSKKGPTWPQTKSG